jgi:hypothetical protein
MATRVNITSIEAIEIFRASLIVYLAKAEATLEEVSAEVDRTRNWVAGTQRVYWETTAKRRARALEEAKAALFESRMSLIKKVSVAEQMAVTKAKRAVEEAEAKLRVIKRWDRDFDNQTGPPARQIEKLHNVLADDMEKAVAYLSQTMQTLEAYANLRSPGLADLPGQPGARNAGDDDAAATLESADADPPAAEVPPAPQGTKS